MADDPCARAEELRRIREDLDAGQAVSVTRFGEDEVRFFKANPERLDRRIAEAEEACALSQNRRPKRRRYAMGARFRPY